MNAGQTPDNPDGRDTPDISIPWPALWDWLGGRLVVVGRGLLLFWLALAGFVLLVALAAVLVLPPAALATRPLGRHLALVVAGLGIVAWLVVAPLVLLGMRSLASLTRRLAGQWCGIPIAQPYLPQPWADGGKAGLRRRLGWLLTDRATWRDLLWVTVNGCGGWILVIVPAGMLALGPLGVIVPYASLEVRLLAIAAAVLGLWGAPWLLHGYGVFARLMLAPTGQAELALRVRQLSQTRTEALDTGAAEIRRIERDLHDGAQARLVAMGMTLDAAGQIIDTNPEAARALLVEARDASVKALAELRALVRGIHPPVLADRGLAAAVEALALDSPMRIHLASDLEGHLPAR